MTGPEARNGDTQAIHATALAHEAGGAGLPEGLLLRGPSGAGKSDLALRLIDRGGWRLVADDRVVLTQTASGLALGAPAAIAGRLEVRGVGIVPVETAAAARLALVVDLVRREAVPRLPAPETVALGGQAVPHLRLHAFDAATPAKIALAFRLLAAGAATPEGAIAPGDADLYEGAHALAGAADALSPSRGRRP